MIIKNNDLIIICNEEIDNEIFYLFSKKVIYEGKNYTPLVRAYLKNALPKLSYFCPYDGMEFTKKQWLSVLLSYYRIFIKYLW